MPHTLTLISNPEKPSIHESHMTRIAAMIGDTPEWRILAEGEAVQLIVSRPISSATKLRDDIRRALPDLAADIIVVSGAPQRAALLVADMESTIIEQECLDELAELIGIRPQIEDITRRAMRGELDFEPALKERVSLLAGLSEEALETIYRERVTLMPGATTLIATLKARGALCALVSGGFTYFAERVAARLGFDVTQSNRLVLVDGKLAGTVEEPILGRSAKADILQHLSQEKAIPLSATMAVGDGSNDLAMLALAGMGVAFRAKPAVAEAASIRIDHGDLTALLYVQGIQKAEFITA